MTKVVKVQDTTPPVITLIGNSETIHEAANTYTDSGASATDGLNGVVSVVTSGSVDVKNVGSYTITYSSTDSSGNTASISRVVTVEDTTAPVITLVGSESVTHEAATAYVDAGVSAVDSLDGAVEVVTTGSVDANKVGSYTLTYTATDAAGNSTSVTRNVSVVDTTAPVITLNGSGSVSHEAATTYSDAGATASDSLEGVMTVTSSGAVNSAKVGSYTLTYTSVDSSGNSSSATRTVTVADTTVPVISINGSASVTHEAGTEYIDLGAAAIDSVGGALEVTTSGLVQSDTTGNYTINYSVTDEAGNTSNASRVVSVVDTTAPIITLNGSGSVVHEAATTYVDEGATATDSVDGSISVDTHGAVDNGVVGTYLLTYNAVDSAGNQSSASRKVVVADTTAPVITLTGNGIITHEAATSYVDLGATAVDSLDGALSVITSGTVDINQVGDYAITYSVTDGAGNLSTASRAVTVTDTMAPVISLKGEEHMTHEAATTYNDAGAVAADSLDGELSVVTSGIADSYVVGKYTIIYKATDAAGNASSATRIVTVDDTTAPIITINGDKRIEHPVDVSYTDTGAVAEDSLDGLVNVDVTGEVNIAVLGTYEIKYSSVDAAGNEAIVKTRTITVVDKTLPVITLLGDEVVEFPVGEFYEDVGATGYDNIDADISSSIKTQIDIDTAKPGEYEVIYSLSDAAGNRATKARTVRIVDRTEPVLTLLGSASVKWEAGVPYVDAGAQAIDNVDGDLTTVIELSSNVNTSLPGSYTVNFNVKDSSGNSASTVSRIVNIVDSVPPVISINGNLTVEVEAGEEYVDNGASVSDNIDGDLTNNLKVVSTVNTGVIGTYSVEYSAVDESGNGAASVTRIVRVADTTPPQLIVNGDTEITISVGQNYTELGASAFDSFEGDLRGNVKVSGTVNNAKPGVYTVTYDVMDKSGNKASSVTRVVNVKDKTPPVLTLNGMSLVTIEVGEEYTENGVLAIDNVDGDISDKVTTIGKVDSSSIGMYELTYSAVDEAGNESATIQRIVMVGDTGFPTISLIGDSAYKVQAGVDFIDPGATATDKVDGDLTSSIIVSGASVNTLKLGSYKLHYDVTDSNGNQAVTITRTILVVDTTPPNVTIMGAKEVILEKGDEYKELGAAAYDNVDGDLTDSLEIIGNVLTTKPGEYRIYYLSVDKLGNTSNSEFRTVQVIDTKKPVIKLLGSATIRIEAGKSYLDPGASVTDYGDGDVSERLAVSGEVNTNILGEYSLIYKASDYYGNDANWITRKVIVDDTIGPDLVLIGGSDYRHEAGSEFMEPGFSAIDLRDGDLTNDVRVSGVVNGSITGVYYLTYEVFDAAGNLSKAVRTVSVGDGTPPEIALHGEEQLEILRGGNYLDAGYAAVDNIDGDLTSKVVVDGSVNTKVPGVYNITYKVTDNAGNAAVAKKRVVTVLSDKTAPVISLGGISEQKLEAGGVYVEFGATATDNIEGNLTDDILIEGNVDVNTPGVYNLFYTVSDKDGNVGMAKRIVEIIDTKSPVVNLFGELAITIELGAQWVEPGYSANDNADGDVSGQVQIEGNVNVNRYGVYRLSYSVTDSAGNTSSVVERNITVGDFGEPKIKLFGDNVVKLEAGTQYVDSGFEALDKKDGNLTANVTVSGNVQTEVPGNYELTYSVTDSDGNLSNLAKRLVVVEDSKVPVITILGDQSVTIEAGGKYVDTGANAIDSLDGDLTGKIQVSSSVDEETVGVYSITYQVQDRSGNYAQKKIRTVNVVDTTPPVLTFNGESVLQIEAGTIYNDPGVVAIDLVDGDLTGQVTISGTVDSKNTGTYELSYQVVDNAGNNSIKLLRSVQVIDTRAPKLTNYKPIKIREETLLELAFEATDHGRTDSVITYTLNNAPEGVILNTGASRIYWTPTEEQGPGTYQFELIASDGLHNTVSDIVVVVEEVNLRPTANDAVFNTLEDQPIVIDLTGSDTESQSLNYRVTSNPSNGKLIGSGNSITYIPNENFEGVDTIGFVTSDGELNSSEALVTINVASINDAPTITSARPIIGREDEMIVITHDDLANLTDAVDVDEDSLIFILTRILSGSVLSSEKSNSVIRLAKGESVKWVPDSNANGLLPVFEIAVSDNVTYSAGSVLLYAEIESVPDNPELNWPSVGEIVYGTPLSEEHLNASVNVGGQLTYEPAAGVILSAGAGQEIRATFTPHDSANYNTISVTQYINVRKAIPIITWPSLRGVESGTKLNDAQLSALANVPGEFNYEPAIGTLLELEDGQTYSTYSLKAVFTPEDKLNYKTVESSNEINIIPLSPENAAPTILANSESLTRIIGENAEFKVAAIGASPLDYQWFKNGELLVGETEPVLSISSVEVINAGIYALKISNKLGVVESEEISLNVLTPPLVVSKTHVDMLLSGNSVEYTTEVSGSTPLNFKWYLNGEELIGVAENGIKLENLRIEDSGIYSLIVENEAGSAEADIINLSVIDPVEIAKGLESVTVTQKGSDLHLSVGVIGGGTMGYQWHHNGSPIESESDGSLLIRGTTELNAGNYHVIVSNELSSAKTSTTLTVTEGPRIQYLDDDKVVVEGKEVSFGVVATGSKPLAYQWFFNGKPIDGKNKNTLVIADAERSNLGLYSVKVSNPFGDTMSDKIRLDVNTPLKITKDLTSENAVVGNQVSIGIEVVGSGPIEYQWYKNGLALVGSSSSVLTFKKVEQGDAAEYFVVAQNRFSKVTSNKILLTVQVGPTLVGEPLSKNIKLGGKLELRVLATGTEPLFYQWNKNGAAIPNANDEVFSVGSAGSDLTGKYTVKVSNKVGVVESNEAVVIVESPVSLVKDLASKNVSSGQQASLEIEVAGMAPITYEWYHGGTRVEGVTGPKLEFGSVKPENQGLYSVVASNRAGGVLSWVSSAEVQLNVLSAPVITNQSQSRSINENSFLGLQVAASGSEPLSINWFKGGKRVGTGRQFIIKNVKASDEGLFYAEVSNAAGSVRGDLISIEILKPIKVTSHPQSLNLTKGQSGQLSIEATGTKPISYQWYKNGKPVSGAVSAAIEITSASTSDAGEYSVLLQNEIGSIQSKLCTVNILTPPVFTDIPDDQIVTSGDDLRLQVLISGTEPITYSWSKDGILLEGQSTNVLSIEKLETSDRGEYKVIAKNSAGIIEESIAVQVYEALKLDISPENVIGYKGSSGEISAKFSGSEPITYQWKFRGSDIIGETGPVLTIENINVNSVGGYQVMATNPVSSLVSDEVSLKMQYPVTIVQQPTATTVRKGQNIYLSVNADGTPPLSYQWRKGENDIAGENAASMKITNADSNSAGDYSVIVTNGGGSVTSTTVPVNVLLPPTIGSLDNIREVALGESISITAPVSGYGTFNYQWLKNGVNIQGATSDTLALGNVTIEDSGGYSLNVGSEGGALYSNTMLLRVKTEATSHGSTPDSATELVGAEGSVRGDTSGGGSVSWFSWTSSENGIVTINTSGSSFDTTLSVFENGEVITYDEDGAEYGASVAQFNAESGVTYLIKVQGVNSATGDLVLSRAFEKTETVLPQIVKQPEDTVVIKGQSGELDVKLKEELGEVVYQWVHNGIQMEGETSSKLIIDNAQNESAGRYAVKISLGGREIISETVQLVVAYDESTPVADVDSKLDFALLSGGESGNSIGSREPSKKEDGPILGGPSLLMRLKAEVRRIQKMPGEFSNTIVSVYSTSGATKEAGEPNHAGKTGGASAWTTFKPGESGTAKISTDSSDFDTVIAIYKVGEGEGWGSLKEVASDDNSGVDGQDSEVVFDVDKNTVYLVAVDGASGESGTIQLNQELAQHPEIVEITSGGAVVEGESLSMAVKATNPLADVELEYQWYFDGTIIDNADSSTLTLSNIEVDQTGDYTVNVSNYAGVVTSDAIAISVVKGVNIHNQPVGGEIRENGKFTMSVTALGSSPITYQWKVDGEIIEGATDSAYTIDSAKPSSAGSYTVDITNPAGTVSSSSASVIVNAPPTITKISGNQSVGEGKGFSLWVGAVGAQPLKYQWKKDGVSIPAGLSNIYQVFSSAEQDNGVYTVEVSNSAGVVTSAPVVVNVLVPPTIVTQPQSKSIGNGGATQLSVAASGTDLSYAWYKDSDFISGESSSILVIGGAKKEDAGNYYVVVSNEAGTIKSVESSVVVYTAPEITVNPGDVLTSAGGVAELSVVAESVGAISYQWKFNGVNLDGEASATLKLSNLTYSQAGDYSVEVSNEAGFVLSDTAEVQVLTPIAIATNPDETNIVEGESGELHVVATGSGPIDYQWYKNDVAIEGQTYNKIIFKAIAREDVGMYSVVVSNPLGSIASKNAMVSVKAKPVIIKQPDEVTVVEGKSMAMNVNATGDGTLSYQWYFNGLAIAGEVSSTLQFKNVEKSNEGMYQVVVRSEYGLVTSERSSLTVLKPVTVSANPVGATVAEYESVTLQVVASGTAPLSYTWYRGNKIIDGATEPALLLDNVRSNEAGEYRVVVSNQINSVESEPASIEVVQPVSIVKDVTQSKSETVLLTDDTGAKREYEYYHEGSYVRLYAVATGTGPIEYQWQKDGINILGKNKATLIFTSIQPEDAGVYRLIARNKVGLKLTEEVVLNVNQLPELQGVKDQLIIAGDSISVDLNATDEDGKHTELTYSLVNHPNGMKIDGKSGKLTWVTSPSLSGGTYTASVVLSDVLGGTDEKSINITVNARPVVEIPTPIDVKVGDKVALTIVGVDPEGGKLSYRALNQPVGFKGGRRNGFNGKFSWSTSSAKRGNYQIDIEVSDPDGGKTIVTAHIYLDPEVKLTLLASNGVKGTYEKTIRNVEWDFDKKEVRVPAGSGMRFFKVQIEGKKSVTLMGIKREQNHVVIRYTFN